LIVAQQDPQVPTGRYGRAEVQDSRSVEHARPVCGEAREPSLVLGDELWIKAALAVAGHFDLDLARVRDHGLAAIMGKEESHYVSTQ
jgi:hypothetical protein